MNVDPIAVRCLLEAAARSMVTERAWMLLVSALVIRAVHRGTPVHGALAGPIARLQGQALAAWERHMVSRREIAISEARASLGMPYDSSSDDDSDASSIPLAQV